MTEISEAAYKRAGEIYEGELQSNVTATCDEAVWHAALARVLQEHSDVAKVVIGGGGSMDDNWEILGKLQPLILPDEPANLAEALGQGFNIEGNAERVADHLRKTLDAAGYQITRKGD